MVAKASIATLEVGSQYFYFMQLREKNIALVAVPAKIGETDFSAVCGMGTEFLHRSPTIDWPYHVRPYQVQIPSYLRVSTKARDIPRRVENQ